LQLYVKWALLPLFSCLSRPGLPEHLTLKTNVIKLAQAWNTGSFKGPYYWCREAEMGSAIQSVTKRESTSIEANNREIKKEPNNCSGILRLWANF
jgi:hypothetical protein